MKFLPIVLIAAIVAVGCGSKPDADYKTEVNLTPEQQQKEKEMMAGQTPPGTAPSQGGTPGTLDRNAGKGGR